MTGRILVTGATGNVGAALLRELHERGAEPIAALTGEEARSRLPAPCEARLCNFNEPSQIAAALDGVEAAFLLVPFDENMLEWGKRFIGHAAENGVRFILRLSALGAALDSGSKMGRLHGRIDDFTSSSGTAVCVLRCNAFMQNFSGLYRHMILQGALALPEGEAELAFVDTGDIAAVANRILVDPAPHAGRVYDLSGPEALSNAKAVETISAITGTRVHYMPTSATQARLAYSKFGISSWKIDVLESLASHIRDGHAAQVTDTVESLLGRRAETFRGFAERHRHCWTGG